MSTINIIEEISRRTKDLNLPLHCFLDVVAIEEEVFQKWFDGGLRPSRQNIRKLKELLQIIESLEQVKNEIICEQQESHNKQILKPVPSIIKNHFLVRQGFVTSDKELFIFDDKAYPIYKNFI